MAIPISTVRVVYDEV